MNPQKVLFQTIKIENENHKIETIFNLKKKTFF